MDSNKLYKTENWGMQIEITDKSQLTEPILNGYISYSLEAYKSRQYKDFDLWEVFVDDFKGWTKDIFDKDSKYAIRDVRDHGVYVNKKPMAPISNELVKVVAEEKPHEWTPQEIQEQLKSSSGNFYSNRYDISKLNLIFSNDERNSEGKQLKIESPQTSPQIPTYRPTTDSCKCNNQTQPQISQRLPVSGSQFVIKTLNPNPKLGPGHTAEKSQTQQKCMTII